MLLSVNLITLPLGRFFFGGYEKGFINNSWN